MTEQNTTITLNPRPICNYCLVISFFLEDMQLFSRRHLIRKHWVRTTKCWWESVHMLKWNLNIHVGWDFLFSVISKALYVCAVYWWCWISLHCEIQNQPLLMKETPWKNISSISHDLENILNSPRKFPITSKKEKQDQTTTFIKIASQEKK